MNHIESIKMYNIFQKFQLRLTSYSSASFLNCNEMHTRSIKHIDNSKTSTTNKSMVKQNQRKLIEVPFQEYKPKSTSKITPFNDLSSAWMMNIQKRRLYYSDIETCLNTFINDQIGMKDTQLSKKKLNEAYNSYSNEQQSSNESKIFLDAFDMEEKSYDKVKSR